MAHTPKHGAFRMGALLLPSERSARSPTSPGRVSERQTLPLWGLGQGYSRRTQKAFGTAMRLCVSLFRGIAAPLGCVICLQLGDVAVFSLCAQYFLNVRGGAAITTLGAFRTFTNIPGPGIRTAYFAAFGPWSRVLPKNTESLRSSDALMRVAAPRRRGPAGLRDLFRFCRSCGLYTLRSELSVRARQGWYHYPRCALHVLETLDGRLSKGLICRFLRLGSLH